MNNFNTGDDEIFIVVELFLAVSFRWKEEQRREKERKKELKMSVRRNNLIRFPFHKTCPFKQALIKKYLILIGIC